MGALGELGSLPSALLIRHSAKNFNFFLKKPLFAECQIGGTRQRGDLTPRLKPPLPLFTPLTPTRRRRPTDAPHRHLGLPGSAAPSAPDPAPPLPGPAPPCWRLRLRLRLATTATRLLYTAASSLRRGRRPAPPRSAAASSRCRRTPWLDLHGSPPAPQRLGLQLGTSLAPPASPLRSSGSLASRRQIRTSGAPSVPRAAAPTSGEVSTELLMDDGDC